MKKYTWVSGLAVLVLTVMLMGSRAYADETANFNQFIQNLQEHRAQMVAKFGVGEDIFPHATCYYDDLVDHYEQVMLMSDYIDKGIR